MLTRQSTSVIYLFIIIRGDIQKEGGIQLRMDVVRYLFIYFVLFYFLFIYLFIIIIIIFFYYFFFWGGGGNNFLNKCNNTSLETIIHKYPGSPGNKCPTVTLPEIIIP